MKDKEKQIEEMKDIVHNLWDKLNQDAITTNDIIDAIYNAGYRKLPENSVVLSREVLNERWIDLLTEFDEMGFEPTTLPPNDMSVEEYTAFFKEKLLMCLAKVSKETVEKILNYAETYLFEDDTDKLYFKEFIKKDLGVEIKE